MGHRAERGGALEAAVEAREEGLVRFIGVTGHGLSVPAMHRRSLERFAFDSVLPPYNYVQMQDARYAETFEALAAVCAERGVALQTIKSLARRRWDGRQHTAATWYEPLREQPDIDLAVSWVLARPEAFLLTTGDVDSCRGCSTPPSGTSGGRRTRRWPPWPPARPPNRCSLSHRRTELSRGTRNGSIQTVRCSCPSDSWISSSSSAAAARPISSPAWSSVVIGTTLSHAARLLS